MMRIGLFILTNLAVMVVFGVILSIFGVDAQSMTGLLILAALFGFGGSFISLWFSKTIAIKSVNAKIITSPRNEQEQWLFDVVKHQARRMNLKMPEIAIYQAKDVNAFATGAKKNASLIAVSSGLLAHMTRNEAEAVVAHEMSHISNGDMITMTLLQGVLNTFVIFISRFLGQIIAQALQDRDKSLSHLAYFGIVMVLEIFFGMLASLIVMWFSRRREFYADAGSAQLVGKEKMIAALIKLKGGAEPEEAASIMALCINGTRKAKFSDLFRSHPTLDDRIQALRDEKYMKVNRTIERSTFL